MEWTAILLSLRVATAATLVATPIAVAVAWLLARREFWGKALLDAAIHLPLVLPPVVTGYLLLLTFGRRGAVGAWLAEYLGLVFAFRWTGAALACGSHVVPAAGTTDPALDRGRGPAARTGRRDAGRRSLAGVPDGNLPLALSGVLAGMVLGFAKALGEFGATITFVSNIPGETQTISSAIYSLISDPGWRYGSVAAGGDIDPDLNGSPCLFRNGFPAARCSACTGVDHVTCRCLEAIR